jgi:hypothetical protein
MGLYLIGTAGVKHADLGRANAAASLIRTNVIREVVVGGAEGASTVVTHPRTARARRDLETDAVVRRRICRRNARTRIGGEKGSGNGKETQKHVYKYNSHPWF